jgi:CDP-6-deoxy-D-xylo-4-hexulose-3-dehydrase
MESCKPASFIPGRIVLFEGSAPLTQWGILVEAQNDRFQLLWVDVAVQSQSELSQKVVECLMEPSGWRSKGIVTVERAVIRETAAIVSHDWLAQALKSTILGLSSSFTALHHAQQFPATDVRKRPYAKGSKVPYAGRVFDEAEVKAAVGAALDFWLTLGSEGESFERRLAAFLGVKRSLLVNSGSSANLLALSALTSHRIEEGRRLKPGDEVITCAAGFPTTVAPILQNRAVPVFIDNDPITGNPRADQLEAAFVEGKTKAVLCAHTLGNPFDLSTVYDFCRRHDLFLIEDNCDALGSRYLPSAEIMARYPELHMHEARLTGAFGDLSTQSFYPPHHLTLGEGGAVNFGKNMLFKVIVESMRDWGRDCWCASGKDDTCGKRFGWQLGELPAGYDHKYVYSHLGYNLKPLDIQAAIGLAQLEKLSGFIQARKENWAFLRHGLNDLSEYFEFALPTHAMGWSAEKGFIPDPQADGAFADPSWFGFLMLIRPEAPFSRLDFVNVLNQARIDSRGLFGGNLLRQPVFTELLKREPDAVRTPVPLVGADRIMNDAVFIGVYPGLSQSMLEYMVESIHDGVRRLLK